MDVEIECEKCFIGVLILYICFASVIYRKGNLCTALE